MVIETWLQEFILNLPHRLLQCLCGNLRMNSCSQVLHHHVRPKWPTSCSWAWSPCLPSAVQAEAMSQEFQPTSHEPVLSQVVLAHLGINTLKYKQQLQLHLSWIQFQPLVAHSLQTLPKDNNIYPLQTGVG